MPDYPQAYQEGDWVAIILPEDVAPSRCFVGAVKTSDEFGITLCLIDKELGLPTTTEIFITGDNISTVLICTSFEDRERFLKQAFDWQTKLDKAPKKKTDEKKTQRITIK